ncbi:hypothetical protein ACOME3_005653 [Neoechinorhynchus agilis]
MGLKLRYHESKLLKKHNFLKWEIDGNNLHENRIMLRYRIPKREDYTIYNQLSRNIRDVATKIRSIDPEDPFRALATDTLLTKLYDMGLIAQKKDLELVSRVNASSFCRRRLPVVMHRSGMVEHLKMAVKYVQHGHVRIGPDIIKDPAFLVTRQMEDHLTWVDSSAIKKKIQSYNDQEDDFEGI